MEKDQEGSCASTVSRNDLDTTDAVPDEYTSPNRSSYNNFSSKVSPSAGSLLLSPPPFFKTAGEVLQKFEAKRDSLLDITDDTDEVFQSEDSDKAEGASNAIKSFMLNELATAAKDAPDAGGEYEGDQFSCDDREQSPAPQPHLGITSAQQQGAQPTENCTSDLEDKFHYDMTYPERGCFVIFNHHKFDLYNKCREKKDHLDKRDGTNIDTLNLEKTFKRLGFEYIKVVHDATRLEILQWIDMLSKADFSDYDCFGCAILTHGGDRDILYARDAAMNLKDFTRPFGADLCPSLAGKPKLFFIQACRGVNFDEGGKLPARRIESDCIDGTQPSSGGDAVDGKAEPEVTIPAEADFLIANSTVPEYYSWRNSNLGSFFVQSLCKVLELYGDRLELMQMMTRVNRMVAYKYESSTGKYETDKMKQIPSIATRLTAEVFFQPKNPEQPREDNEQASCSPPPAVSQTTVQFESSVTRHTAEEDYTSSERCIVTTTEISLETSSQDRSSTFSDQSAPPLPLKVMKSSPVPEMGTSVRPCPSEEVTITLQTSQNSNQNETILPRVNASSRNVSHPGVAPSPYDSSNQGPSCEVGPATDDVKSFHEISAESQAFLRAVPGNRQTPMRRSCPEARRLVTQISGNYIEIPGRKTKKYFEESDL